MLWPGGLPSVAFFEFREVKIAASQTYAFSNSRKIRNILPMISQKPLDNFFASTSLHVG